MYVLSSSTDAPAVVSVLVQMYMYSELRTPRLRRGLLSFLLFHHE
jgi:hypothetical protein